MLECRACLLRCLRAIAADGAPTVRPAACRRTFFAGRRRSTTSRGFATEVERVDSYAFQREAQAGKNDKLRPTTDRWRHLINQEKRTRVGVDDKDKAEDEDHDAHADDKADQQMEYAVRQELRYLKDPLKLAGHVRQTLRTNDFDKAMALCRTASREMQCIVSWNHCIDWLMARREVKKALKIYNDMKKRAQHPDSHTILLILRGMAIPPVHRDIVRQALPIYHALDAPNSRVKRSIIHTNAALKVCARAYDMESMWGVASRIPDRGPAAADAFTFTTILNAIKENALLTSEQEKDDEGRAAQRAQAVQEGRRIWEDVIGKWRRGSLLIDQELVCAMGRLLLISTRARDWDDVLSLIEQTMDVPRLAPKLGSEERRAEHLLINKDRTIARPPPEEKEAEAEQELESSRGGEFDTKLARKERSTGIEFVAPSNNVVSLVLESCLKTLAPKVATAYWQLLTKSDTYTIKPDLDNYHMYLRLLRQQRASSQAVELLRQLTMDGAADLLPRRKTFRIAMSVCVRDKKNRHAVANSHSMLDMMEQHLVDVDAKSLTLFLDLALSTEDGPTIVRAFDRLSVHLHTLRSQVAYGQTEGGRMPPGAMDEAFEFFRTIVGTIDVLMSRGMVPRDQYSTWSQRRSKTAAFVGRQLVKQKGSDNAPKLPHGKVLEMRRESRQLRHLRQKNKEREKRGEPIRPPEPEAWRARNATRRAVSAQLVDLPGEQVGHVVRRSWSPNNE